MVRSTPQPLYKFRPSNSNLSISHPQSTSYSKINHIAFVNRPLTDHHLNHSLSLLTTDNLGWISLWDLESKRIQLLWQPHPLSNISGGCLWAHQIASHNNLDTKFIQSESIKNSNRSLFILSHGRDHRLVLSQLPPKPSIALNRATIRPSIRSPSSDVKILTESPTNALSFCKPTCLSIHPHILLSVKQDQTFDSILAAPSSLNEELVDIFAIKTNPPQLTRIHKGLGQHQADSHTGSVMSLKLYSSPQVPDLIFLLVGYESGQVSLFKQAAINLDRQSSWSQVGSFKNHSEPVLGVAIAIDPNDPMGGIGWSIGADSNIGRYCFSICKSKHSELDSNRVADGSSDSCSEEYQVHLTSSKHATSDPGRFDISVRSDGKLMAIYSWGGKIWLFDTRIKPNQSTSSSIENSNSLIPVGLLPIQTEDESQSGVLAFSPFPPDQSTIDDASLNQVEVNFDSLTQRALLVASGYSNHVLAWEVFPEHT
ncbi:hypothetical protein O181_015423 [Austropuccinia psidii MF-1]|uniref:ASTRA-associated protein 1 n=1 Tax=Austropuccinia psidii MF-1 TaxID=1389203 RepID=A0A9Q3C373_9BASI|nr:hypothetical protein [Austropuccinia psidii MF-1]